MEVAPGVYSIGHRAGRRAYLSGYSRAYLLDTGETGLMLIDALGDADARLVLEQLERLGRRVEDLKHILLTHSHRSHVMGVARLKLLSGATVHSHEWEADIIEARRKAHPVSPRPVRPLSLQTMRLGLWLGAKHPPCRVDEHLDEGRPVGPVRVIHTPGHTPGHVVFYWPERQTLFTGDNIATWPQFGAGWPGFQLDDSQFRASLRHMADSVRSMAKHNPPVAVIAVSHGEPVIRGATERLNSLVEAAMTPTG
jgi:glyoxylase-like metal-dependent hydrolase (beta-lactamase superfamily II)